MHMLSITAGFHETLLDIHDALLGSEASRLATAALARAVHQHGSILPCGWSHFFYSFQKTECLILCSRVRTKEKMLHAGDKDIAAHMRLAALYPA